MKKISKSIKLVALLVACLAIPSLAGAQVVKNAYFNIDWQVNSPFGQDFSDKTSGWGAHFEGGYYFTPNISGGLFLSYHTNNKYIDRQTLPVSSTSVITADQQHSIFQLPFGAVFRYNFAPEGQFQPYLGAGLGASYSEMSSYMNVLKVYDRNWGFYVSPEVGMNIYFTPQKQFGVHIAAYYNYATNKGEVLNYSVDGLNNWGIRLGVAF
ncbi:MULTISPECIES: outer membrane beta-barrel protein [Parabacteroides]|uniref:outer membrane beta-barrel protein n=1 Tax=Parabacteroides provencensis TaxID=1944636 RepID=UPI000C146A11|nr:outer membrane beta-barrel protein [Parabacteroides provencensis]